MLKLEGHADVIQRDRFRLTAKIIIYSTVVLCIIIVCIWASIGISKSLNKKINSEDANTINNLVSAVVEHQYGVSLSLSFVYDGVSHVCNLTAPIYSPLACNMYVNKTDIYVSKFGECSWDKDNNNNKWELLYFAFAFVWLLICMITTWFVVYYKRALHEFNLRY